MAQGYPSVEKHRVNQVKRIISLQDFSEPSLCQRVLHIDGLGLSGVLTGLDIPTCTGAGE